MHGRTPQPTAVLLLPPCPPLRLKQKQKKREWEHGGCNNEFRKRSSAVIATAVKTSKEKKGVAPYPNVEFQHHPLSLLFFSSNLEEFRQKTRSKIGKFSRCTGKRSTHRHTYRSSRLDEKKRQLQWKSKKETYCFEVLLRFSSIVKVTQDIVHREGPTQICRGDRYLN